MEVSLENVIVMSVSEPAGIGTRRADPSSFPESSGMTFVTALAAQVEVGMRLLGVALSLIHI
mgnify:FL=1